MLKRRYRKVPAFALSGKSGKQAGFLYRICRRFFRFVLYFSMIFQYNKGTKILKEVF